MRTRVAVMVLALSTAVPAAMLVPRTGSASVAKVPTCIVIPLHNHVIPGAQIQVGYCP